MGRAKTQLIYSTGIDQIDEEHRLMLVLIEELDCLLKQKDKDQEGLLHCCNRLFTTIRLHYDHEENLMLKHFFPDTEAHIGQHMNFISMVGKLIHLIREQEYTTAISTLDFIANWKANHIIEADKKYAEFIKTKTA